MTEQKTDRWKKHCVLVLPFVFLRVQTFVRGPKLILQ